MEVLLCIIYATIFIWLIFKLKFFEADGLSRLALSGIFLLKISCGIALWAVYTYLYTDRKTADIFKFFDDSKFIYGALFTAPFDYVKMIFGIGSSSPHFDIYYMQMNHWHREFETGFYNEYRTLIRLNAILRIFSFGYFNVHTVFMSFLSLIGLTGLYKTFVPFLKNKKRELIVAVFLIPSVLFWGSGVLKESLILFVFGMLIYFFFKAISKNSFSDVLMFIVFLVLLFFTRLHLFFIALPALAAYWWVKKSEGKNAALKYLFVFGVYFFAGLNVHYFFPKYNPLEIVAEKQHQAITLANGGAWLMHDNKLVYIEPQIENRIIQLGNQYGKINPGVPYKYYYREHPKDTFTVAASADTATYWIFYDQRKAKSTISIGWLEPGVWSFLKNTPQAILNSVFRPHLFEANSILLLLPAIENLFIVAFILICLLFLSKKVLQKNLFYFCLSISLLLLILVGLTTPVMGALVRYKVPAMPFLLVSILLILDKDKFLTWLSALKKKEATNQYPKT